MSGWTVPLSSSPPLTPDSRHHDPNNHGHASSSFAPNPSTTPAGPPPSSAASFTPNEPPPSSIFGSSQLGPGNTLFQTKSSFPPNIGSRRDSDRLSIKPLTSGQPVSSFDRPTFSDPKGATRSDSSVVPNHNQGVGSAGSNSEASDVGSEEEDGDFSEEDAGSSDKDPMEMFSDTENQPADKDLFEPVSATRTLNSSGLYDWAQHGSSMGPPRGVKRSQTGATITHSSSGRGMQLTKKKNSTIPTIARDLARQAGRASLNEPADLILETEDLISNLYPTDGISEEQEKVIDAALTRVPEALGKLWRSCCDQNRPRSLGNEFTIRIGPRQDEPPLNKATFLGDLLLQLHHPPAAKGKQAFAISRSVRRSFSSSLRGLDTPLRPKSLSEVLLEWLEDHHNPYPTAIADLRSYYPNLAAHPNFWDIVLSAILRGRFADVIRVFKEADFKYARTAGDDGRGQEGYHGLQLGNTSRVVNRAIQVLEQCPALQDDDWNIIGSEWTIYRKRVEKAVADLATFAEGRDRDLDPVESTFEAENFGIRGHSTSLSQSSRRAESKVPWTIYQNLKAMYGILLGGTTEIISFAQDWVEATLCLTVWWDGDDDDEIAVGSLAMTRRSLRRSQSQIPRSVDANTVNAYLRRLAYAFERVTDESDEDSFQINTMDAIEVGLAAIFEGDVEAVIGLLHVWSLPIASAVVEIASMGGWFLSSTGAGITDGFNESDLMVLSYDQPLKGLSKDGVLVDYAAMLFEKEVLPAQGNLPTTEGWEVSIQVLTRLDDTTLANKKVGDLLGRIPMVSDLRVDKLLDVCNAFGLDREACDIAEKYGDSIASSSDKYGTALVYYARSHTPKKVKDVLDLLISLSLVQSSAYPPPSTIDQNLKVLLSSPKKSFAQLAEIDSQASQLLNQYMSGYATLRKFYDLRDSATHLEVNDHQQQQTQPNMPPLSRKKAAASSLLAVIESAADNIYGGLYDPSRNSVVHVDALLALLGEATLFVDQPGPRVLEVSQLMTLLEAIEALQTVPSAVYERCEVCLRATIGAYRRGKGGLGGLDARELMRKSTSGLSGSSFEVVEEWVGEGGGDGDGDSGSRSRVRRNANANANGDDDGIRRGWDWRDGLLGERRLTGSDILGALRRGIAREVGRAWVE